ncbi:MAG: hypothetical protein QW815_09620 [Nitrososphaerota archaeon]
MFALLLSPTRSGATNIVVGDELKLCVGKLLGTVRAVSNTAHCKSWETAVTIPLIAPATGSPIGGAGKLNTSNIRYIAMFYKDDSANESEVEQRIPNCGEITNLYVNSKNLLAATGPNQFYTLTLRRNGLDTSVTCTMILPADSCSNTIDSAVYRQGDRITLKAVPSANPPPTGEDIHWSATFIPLDPNDPACLD